MAKFKKGDWVRVLKKAESFKKGWDNMWIPKMDPAVDKTFEVLGSESFYGILLDSKNICGANYYFPPFVLAKVSKLKKDDSWKPWIELVENNRVSETLKQTPGTYWNLVALALSVAKWHPNRGNDQGYARRCCEPAGVYQVFDHISTCGLCNLYNDNCTKGINKACPLAKAGHRCLDNDSYFRKWKLADSAKAVEAEKLYRLLYKLYQEEYERVLG